MDKKFVVIKDVNNIEFKLKEYQDFSWLNDLGTAFLAIDETGSGCISFGIEKDNKKYFYKIAGAKTVESEVSEEESINILKKAEKKYLDIKHPNLIEYIKSFSIKEFYVLVFEFADGECLFDHWNFENYKTKNITNTPIKRFKELPVKKRLDVIEKLFSFFNTVIKAGYIAVDFYDSSIIYDFNKDIVTFCDIDLFEKFPYINNLGKDYFGTKRLKAPEENEYGVVIDEKTSEFTLGAIIFDILSNVKNNAERYECGCFIKNNIEDFELSEKCYRVLEKATSYDKDSGYNSIEEFYKEWLSCTNKL